MKFVDGWKWGAKREILTLVLPEQQLDGEIVPITGIIPDTIGLLTAQLLEQPAGAGTGTGTLTFASTPSAVTNDGTANASVSGSVIEFTYGTIWNVACTVSGESVLIPDPYTGYDINGNYNGTPTNITSITQDVYAKIQSVGFNKYFKCLTSGTIMIIYEGIYTYRYYDLSTTTWSDESGTVTSGNYLEIAMEIGDLVGLIKIDGVYPSGDVDDWNIVSGTFENHLVPADLSAPTYDVHGNLLHYLPSGILPLGSIEFSQ